MRVVWKSQYRNVRLHGARQHVFKERFSRRYVVYRFFTLSKLFLWNFVHASFSSTIEIAEISYPYRLRTQNSIIVLTQSRSQTVMVDHTSAGYIRITSRHQHSPWSWMRAVTGWWIIRWSHGSVADDGSYARAYLTTAILPPAVLTVLPSSRLPIHASCILLPTGVCNPCRGRKKVHRRRPNVPTEFPISSVADPIPGRRDLTTGAKGPSDEIEGALVVSLRVSFPAAALCRGDNRYRSPIHLRVAPVRTGHPDTTSSRGHCRLYDTSKWQRDRSLVAVTCRDTRRSS